MIYAVSHQNKAIDVRITLPASKSVANRILLIRALCGSMFPVHNIPESDDSQVLVRALDAFEKERVIDIGHAGTSMRFLTAFLAIQEGREFVLTGSERMKNRPIAKLVDALRAMGADIHYMEKEGYPPLQIKGKSLPGGCVTIDGGISSQYISAILMIAPSMAQGLELILEGEVISASYIRMTLDIMRYFGVESAWDGDRIRIAQQSYTPKEIRVEPDWSAASYWYQIAALSRQAIVHLLGLTKNSFQGDAYVATLFEMLGVTTSFSPEGALLEKKGGAVRAFSFDFIENPDLVQTFAVTLCLQQIPYVFHGTQTLKIKETDRIVALTEELRKLGYELKSPTVREMSWEGQCVDAPAMPVIKTYDDHRMAMCFAPAALVRSEMLIADPLVVAKSYPSFWDDLRLAGFQVETCVDH